MRILVCVKQVPATAHVTVDEKTGVLQREGVESKLNPYDLFALETALRLREEAGGTVTAITMGPPQGPMCSPPVTRFPRASPPSARST